MKHFALRATPVNVVPAVLLVLSLLELAYVRLLGG